MNPAAESSSQQEARKSSTLIEFPGVSRSSRPEWRKELSERVREVQERKAREAAESKSELTDSSALPPQLELLPQAEMPPINPLVAAALRRIERAYQSPLETQGSGDSAVAALAYAPSREENELSESASLPPAEVVFEAPSEINEPEFVEEPKLEKSHGLVVVTPSQPLIAPLPLPPPKRLIRDDPNDPALNYLDSISRTLCVDEKDSNRAPTFKRFAAGMLDLLISAILSSPVPLAMKLSGTNLQDPRALIVIAGSAVVMIFIYLTLTIALTGRTWAMRLFRLRVIDRKTGLIPTGGQSVGRAFLYLLSLAAVGFGILFALISREGYTVHDQLTRTAVISI